MFLSSLVQRFAPPIVALCAVIAQHAGRVHAAVPLVALAHGRLRRLLTRLDRLAMLFRDRRLPRARAPRAGTAGKRGGIRAASPSGMGWLVRVAPPALQLRPLVEALVADAETLALAEAAPQAGRLLRPLCRMMGIQPPPGLLLPRRVRKQAPAAPVAVPVAAPAARLDERGLLRVPARLRLRVPGMPVGWHLRRARCPPG